ncbi:MAG TPA: GntR family transcriptional regulator [Microbacterium sp.]|uniref:GntR family transcriptional regulator n=1 Tax=Microbacterium TaxID=33882 RepID=UPI00286A46CA|nr:GntR family transcriptional regulator [Microbacterium trichothecenolyticum]
MTTRGELTSEHGATSMRESIADVLRMEIVQGTLAPGTKLSEGRLAERFGTSRMPVREALQMLARADFVIVEQRRGTFVRGVSQREIVDLYEVREALEGMAARLCATRASEELLDRLDMLMQRMASAVAADDSAAYIEADEQMHGLIFEGSANSRLMDQYRLLSDHLHRNYLSTVVTRRPGRLSRSMSEHQIVVEAVRMRDADSAERAMRHHVTQGRQELAQQMMQTNLDG